MKCIIIDDEPLAQQIIEEYITNIPFLTLERKCSSVFEALEILQKTKIDLIFLDIHLPNVNGVEFISSLDTKPMFIFTTAYSEYALEAFDLNAVDYLLKPIPFKRFLRAANKAYQLYSATNKVKKEEPLENNESEQDFIMVKSDYKSVKIQLNQVLYIEGLKDYVKIYIQNEDKPIITLNSLKKMADSLPSSHFLRVHKSFIINTNKIKSVTKNRIIIHDRWIPVGDNYKSDFQSSVINRFTL
ncbi:LytTR family DNA-binding domain-containing protein [Mangrovibacterium marinum]|uniref:LytTR family two component transcriptional regulator n=1 Tax=Mangrovibacterium marinum TaxID=1639118 RepID=A0A2T5C3J0_9BACT|nr:LytTR family DNA-binding domain-containing protein [Mangrovibacterium marinum]PTN09352.1 LytTR family two component transcriptional regulator [Mangrovibacterium marinum]